MNNKNVYIVSAVITTVIFAIGIFIGIRISEIHIQGFQSQLEASALELQSIDLESTIIGMIDSSSLCPYLSNRAIELAKSKTLLAEKFERLEGNERDRLYKEFVITQMKYWTLLRLQEKQCNIKNVAIVFFFAENDGVSDRLGTVLDYIVYKAYNANETVSVFALNAKKDEPLITLMKDAYNITEIPSLVIEGKTYPGFMETKELEHVVCGHYNLSIC